MRLSIPPKSFLLLAGLLLCQITAAQEPAVNVDQPLDESGNLVRFDRDIAPILRSRCLECHGPEDAKEDFRVDDPEVLMQYIEPGDFESSTLYTDYLTAEDVDGRMPPHEKSGPLSPGELALIRVWIDEGAVWPDGFEMTQASIEAAATPAVPPKTFGQRLFRAAGYLHPATIHFPIALFSLGALFVVVGFKWPALGTQIPLACLLIGTASAIAAATMGWSLAPTKGYDAGWEFLNFDREVRRASLECCDRYFRGLHLFIAGSDRDREEERASDEHVEDRAVGLWNRDRASGTPRW